MKRLSLSSRIRIAPDVLVQPVGGELVMLDLTQEKYFGLDPVGTRIWELLQNAGDLNQVHAAMLDEFEVAPEKLEADLLELIGSMERAGILSVEEDDARDPA